MAVGGTLAWKMWGPRLAGGYAADRPLLNLGIAPDGVCVAAAFQKGATCPGLALRPYSESGRLRGFSRPAARQNRASRPLDPPPGDRWVEVDLQGCAPILDLFANGASYARTTLSRAEPTPPTSLFFCRFLLGRRVFRFTLQKATGLTANTLRSRPIASSVDRRYSLMV